MEKKIVNQIYFSPTGNCKKVSATIVKEVENNSNIEIKEIDITPPEAREAEIFIPKDELLVIVMPIYASRLPNKVMPFVKDMIKSDGAKAIIGVTFGNRSFGDGLVELRNLLQDNGFIVISAAACACEHSFATKAGEGRPNEEDIEEIRAFARTSMEILPMVSAEAYIHIDGNDPPQGYYQPKGIDGEPTVFLKAKPKTKEGLCDGCNSCADSCPMGSIDKTSPTNVSGICIKCHACVKACPKGAKYFDDPAFLSHKAYLLANFVDANNNAFYYAK